MEDKKLIGVAAALKMASERGYLPKKPTNAAETTSSLKHLECNSAREVQSSDK